MLHGFSCDIVIRSLSSGEAYNIELDGPAHLLPRKQLLCDLRDSFLQEACGVRVVRVNLCTLPPHIDEETMTTILTSNIGFLSSA